MPPAASSTAPASPASSTQGSGGLYDGRWTSVLVTLLRLLPAWVCECFARLVITVIYLLAGPQRRAVVANLDALHFQDGPLVAWLRGWCVFHQFALTYLDRLWHLHLGSPVEWTATGEPNLDSVKAGKEGALIFTIHAGNYDLGTTLCAEKLGRELHIVRVPEQTESLQEVRERELRSCHPLLHVHYNKPDSHLGLTLCRLLQAGKIVAIQGDRVVMDVAPVIVQRGGLSFRLPLGPLVLAEMTRVPCYPIFLHRTGRLRYQVDIFPAFHGQGERLSQTEIAQRWLSVMHPFVKQHWDQWFVFEHLVTR